MGKKEELHELGVQQSAEENSLKDIYFKTHKKPNGRDCIEYPGMKELKEKYRNRYFEIIKKYKGK